MNILVVGLGSMGKRRIRLLRENLKIHTITGVDTKEERINYVRDEYNIKAYSNISEALSKNDYTAAFVCTAPLSHINIIDICLDHRINVFSEINLVSDGYNDIIKKANDYNCKLFLSSTPMYRKEIQYTTQKVKESMQRLNYIYHVGQYLPDWHPWESYNDFFVGDKRTNGCRELFAIELPWIIDAFGDIESIHSIKDKISNLEIDYCDNYIVVVTHKSGHKGVLCFDIVSRKATRTLEVLGENTHIKWGGTPESLFEYNIKDAIDVKVDTYDSVNRNSNYSGNIIENMYVDEILAFMSYLQHDTVPLYSFEKDLYTLSIIDEIERI